MPLERKDDLDGFDSAGRDLPQGPIPVGRTGAVVSFLSANPLSGWIHPGFYLFGIAVWAEELVGLPAGAKVADWQERGTRLGGLALSPVWFWVPGKKSALLFRKWSLAPAS